MRPRIWKRARTDIWESLEGTEGGGNDIIKSILNNKTILKVESSKEDLFIVATLGRGTKNPVNLLLSPFVFRGLEVRLKSEQKTRDLYSSFKEGMVLPTTD